MGDHSETIRIQYDPEIISYRDLLDVFFSSHDSGWSSPVRQYRSVILYSSEDQRKAASEALVLQTALTGRAVQTALEPLDRFYPAEDYHQKYYLRNTGLLFAEFSAIYPDDGDFARSTAAARANGYLGGNGSSESLEREGPYLGLSERALAVLKGLVSRYRE